MYRIALAWLAVTFTFAGAQGDPPVVTLAGAVPVFVFAGQSNAVGVDTLDELRADQRAPQPNVLFYGPNETGNTWGVFTPSSNSPNRIDGTGRVMAVLVRRSLRARPFPMRWVARWWRK